MARPATKRVPSVASTSSAASVPAKHAPPARPHPFPLLSSHQQRSASASATLPTTSSLSSNSVNSGWTMVGSGSATSSSRVVGGSELGSSSDAERSTTNGRGKSHSTTDAPRAGGSSSICFAGSPPTDVGSTAAEAVLQASMSSLSPVSSDVDTASPEARTSLSNINTGLEKKHEREAIESVSTIRHNYLDIVKDPFAALDSLMLSSSSTDVALNPPTPSSSDPMTPSSALERQKNHVQQLGRGFNDLRSPGASPLPTPMPRSASQSVAARKFARADSFDPMTMAGDGIIMSGTRWGNSRSNLNKQGSTSSRDSNDEDSLYEALPSNDPTRSSIEAPIVSSSPRASATLGLSPGVGLRREKSVRTKRRWREFYRSLQCETASAQRSSSSSSTSSGVDVSKLRELAWNGIPSELRPIVWPMLLGYLPPQASTRSTTLARKREEYRKAVQLAFGQDPFETQGSATSGQIATPPTSASPAPLASSSSGRGTPIGGRSRGSEEEKLWHQISIDVPRTNPRIPLWQRPTTQRSLERLLYVWAIRHHATGYVQGMSDLATPFYQVFLSIYLQEGGSRTDVVEDFDTTHLPKEILLAVEADSYWCLGKLLDGIQENYIHNQPGIIRQVRRMEELVGRIDGEYLSRHSSPASCTHYLLPSFALQLLSTSIYVPNQ